MLPRVPSWELALNRLPIWWHGKCSSPFAWAHPFIYSSSANAAIAVASDMHDGGFGPLRLPGSGFESRGRGEWNQAYRQCLRDKNHKRIAAVHYAGLVLGSRGPWEHSWKEMEARGWEVWDDFVNTGPALALDYRRAMAENWKKTIGGGK